MSTPDKHSNKPKTNKRKKASRIPSRIEDLLAMDNVNDVLQEIDNTKPHISDILVIYIDKRDNQIYFEPTKETLRSLLVFMMESVKLTLLTEDDEDE